MNSRTPPFLRAHYSTSLANSLRATHFQANTPASMGRQFLALLLAAAAIGSAVAHGGEEHEEASSSSVEGSGTSVEVVGDECDAETSAEAIATIDNSTYFSTCAEAEEGVTFNLSTLFDALDLSSEDFLLFCNSSTCLEPMHELLSLPSDCLIEYEGSDRNLSAEVKDIHDQCHELLEATEGSASNSSASASTDNAASAVFPALFAGVIASVASSLVL